MDTRQTDVYDVLVATVGDTCPDCEDPGSCQAQAECQRHSEELLSSAFPVWDRVA